MTGTRHERWCEDQSRGHAGACVLYGTSTTTNGGRVITTTAEATPDSGAVVVVTTMVRDRDPARLLLHPSEAIVIGRGLIRLGRAFDAARVPRRSPTPAITTARVNGAPVVSH